MCRGVRTRHYADRGDTVTTVHFHHAYSVYSMANVASNNNDNINDYGVEIHKSFTLGSANLDYWLSVACIR